MRWDGAGLDEMGWDVVEWDDIVTGLDEKDWDEMWWVGMALGREGVGGWSEIE